MSSNQLKKINYKYNKYKYKYELLKKQMRGGGGDPPDLLHKPTDPIPDPIPDMDIHINPDGAPHLGERTPTKQLKDNVSYIIKKAIEKFKEKYGDLPNPESDNNVFCEYFNMLVDIKLLKLQRSQHRKLPDDWNDKSNIENKIICENGNIIYTLKKSVKMSAAKIEVSDIIKRLESKDPTFELDFGWSQQYKMLYLNFISTNSSEFDETNFVLEPMSLPDKPKPEPYAYWSDKCNEKPKDEQFYALLSRKFTTKLTGAWLGPIPQETFNENYAKLDLSNSLPLRNMSTP